MSTTVGPPAPRPCASCPYRRDVPAGVWDFDQYQKLREYDEPSHRQPLGLFQCHQVDRHGEHRRICSGWVGCHDTAHLLALRLARQDRRISPQTFTTAMDYVSPVPLWTSGAEAADHGQSGIDNLDRAAVRMIIKITRTRRDLS